MDWRDRVLKLMKDRNFKTRNDLCIKAGISAGSLNMALNGTHELKLSTMGKLSDALETTTRWLLYGDETAEARQVPVLDKQAIATFTLAGETPENCRQIQIGHSLRVSKEAYAWKNYQDDMLPDFRSGDMLIIDPCSPDELNTKQSVYFMVASGYCKTETLELMDCIKYGRSVRFYISNLVNLSSLLHFQSSNSRAEPELFRFPTKESDGKFCVPIGIVVQLIRTFVHASDAN